ncbi:flagellin/flagellar hook associated protein [Pantoea sp. DY-17]|uniref:flagellin N-terminal helical domain-containing protein n=1 Tax=Pantoea sp. DY-17 TaxID=2871490 RepID=UPI001C945ECC|nr:flagellin/flagellar hook associated protein [Pantoea sp. DY-17]MBY4953626.1 flagellin/flagellar hook associated protein [Pantoea sp. DY-17]
MRVNSFSFSSTMLNSMGRNTTQLNKLMMQITEQKRVLNPSDDPIASTQLSQIRREQVAIGQYQSNIERLGHSLGQQETLVDSSSKQLLNMLDKLREANNSSHGAVDMAGYATELSAMKEMLVEQMNSRDESGRYLFAGTKTNQQPVMRDATTGEWIFAGNHESNNTPVANGVLMKSNTDLAAAFGDDLKLLNQLETLLEKMSDPTVAPESYADEMTAMIGQVQSTSDNVAAIFTELGGRQNNMALLQDVHLDSKMIHDEVANGLEGLDIATAMTNLNNYTMATQYSYKAYGQISSLSLFNLG